MVMKKEDKISILFVCMGNICRSPTAEGVFRKLVSDAGLEERIIADSAGTHAYHLGEGPDRRGMEAADRRGYSLKGLRSRRVRDSDFDEFDYILVMDDDNLAKMHEVAEDGQGGNVHLFLDFAESSTLTEVPDPYYGGLAGFERVLDLVEEASAGLLAEIKKHL
jgi:protein-tyrosine phosphatase|tara:strand:- start:87 stop:578 length:492 start_codon:yes stop_codon:yes gene_type:complete